MFRNRIKILKKILKYTIGCGLIFFIIKSLLDKDSIETKLKDLNRLLVRK